MGRIQVSERSSQIRCSRTIPNYETKPNYTIRIKSTGAGGLSVEKEVSIAISNLNESSTDIILRNTTISENTAAMKDKWIKLLNQLELFSEKTIFTEKDLHEYEQKNKIIFPVEYKIFCQIFGTGILGNYIIIYSIDINDDKSCFVSVKDFSSNIFCFARDKSSDCSIFWDLDTYSDLDKSYDIYIVESYYFYDDEYYKPYKIGRNFYNFVRDFCLGMKSYEILPESMKPDPQSLIHIFYPANKNYWQSIQPIENLEVFPISFWEQKQTNTLKYLHLPFEIDDSKPLTSELVEDPSIQALSAVKENKFYAFFRYLKSFRKHLGAVYSVKFTPDIQTLISTSQDSTIKLWNLNTCEEKLTLRGHTQAIVSSAISPDGKILATGSEDTTIKLWDLTTNQEIQTLEGHTISVISLAISPDGKVLVSGSADTTIKLWDLNTGQVIHTLRGHTESVLCVVISPDGQTLASSSADTSIKLWNLNTGEEIRTLQRGNGFVFALNFHPSGKTLISGGEDRNLTLWDLLSYEIIRTISTTYVVISLMISPDGESVACSYESPIDKVAYIWDINTGKTLTYFILDYSTNSFLNHCDLVYSVAFSPDGKQLATGSRDTTVKLWGIPPSLEHKPS